MSKPIVSGGWASVATALRDSTPVILWMIEDETPPEGPAVRGILDAKSQGEYRLLAPLWRSTALLL
jgi:hypothetical protein